MGTVRLKICWYPVSPRAYLSLHIKVRPEELYVKIALFFICLNIKLGLNCKMPMAGCAGCRAKDGAKHLAGGHHGVPQGQ